MKRKIFIALCVLFAFLCIFLLLNSSSEVPEVPAVTLKTNTNITAKTDSDGDGAPDWLEEVAGTDVSEVSSFPYRRDVALAKHISADDLLYGGPGEFTEEIVRKLLSGGGDSPVSPEDKERFVDESVDYFLKRVEQRGLPKVSLSVDNAAPRQKLLKDFFLSLKKISDERQSINVLVTEIFAKNISVLPKAERMRLACKYALDNMPRKVPSEIYDQYHLVLERITFSCEALLVSLASNNAESFFYSFYLLNSGKLFDGSDAVSGEEIQKYFIEAISHVVAFLRKN